jgi:hypothetical protein
LQDQYLHLVTQREHARADERDALDREDLEALTSATIRRRRVENALEKLQANRRDQS